MHRMAKGRDSAWNGVAAAGVTLLFLLIHSEIAQAATYTVGDSGGWTFNVVNWPNGKRFKAGDVLGKFLSFTNLLELMHQISSNLVETELCSH